MKPVSIAAAPLTEADLSQYGETGWLVRRNFFDAADTEKIAQWTEEVTAMPETPGKHMVYYEPSLITPGARVIQRIENFCPYHDGFDTLVRHSRLAQAVDQLFGAPSCLFKDKINYKMPGGHGFEPHQDQQAGWTRYASIFVTALVCIDHATLTNGCLEMPTVRRLRNLIGAEWRPLTADEMASFDLVPMETRPGDVIFFDSYVPHASKSNLTDEERRILYLSYNRLCDGDHRTQYFAEKRANFPPDIEREPGRTYKFRV